jgi:recombination protein RecT
MTALAELKQKAKLPAKQAGGNTVAAFFESNKASLAAVLPKHVSADRMLKIALSAMRTTPKLMDCTIESLMGAVVQCAQLGLEPNTILGHAYLIPFENRKAGRTDVQVIIGYKGLLDLARRSGQIISIAAHDVCENDHFDYAYGLDERLEHKPAMGERGEVIAFYSVAKLVGGGHAFEVVPRAEVDKIRDASQGYKMAKRYNRADAPWIANYTEMGRKTCIRRLFKYLPVSIEIAQATALDTLAESGSDQKLDTALQGEWSVVPDQAQDALTDGTGELNLTAVMTGITQAGAITDIDEWLDAARDADLSDAEHKQVQAAADARRAQMEEKVA